MIKLDDDLLKELGLDALPKEEKAAFLRHMYETLEMRVGTRLAERMTEQQMVEFEQFINTGDEQGAFKWLEGNFPHYKQVVAEEFEKLKNEVLPVAAQIVAASLGQGAGQNDAQGGGQVGQSGQHDQTQGAPQGQISQQQAQPQTTYAPVTPPAPSGTQQEYGQAA